MTNSFDIFGLDIVQNNIDGKNRENDREKELRKKYPNANIQREVYLRTEDGRRAKDTGFTDEARRLDFVVIENGKIVHIEEVTSIKSSKTAQEAKTKRIRGQGPIYIKDRRTKQLIKLNSRREIKTCRKK